MKEDKYLSENGKGTDFTEHELNKYETIRYRTVPTEISLTNKYLLEYYIDFILYTREQKADQMPR